MRRYRVLSTTEKIDETEFAQATVAASAFALAALFSFGWSAQDGVSLSVEKAEARVGRPLTPVSVAGVARRQYRRAVVGTTAAVGAGAAYHGVKVTTLVVPTTAVTFAERGQPIMVDPQRPFLMAAPLTTR